MFEYTINGDPITRLNAIRDDASRRHVRRPAAGGRRRERRARHQAGHRPRLLPHAAEPLVRTVRLARGAPGDEPRGRPQGDRRRPPARPRQPVVPDLPGGLLRVRRGHRHRHVPVRRRQGQVADGDRRLRRRVRVRDDRADDPEHHAARRDRPGPAGRDRHHGQHHGRSSRPRRPTSTTPSSRATDSSRRGADGPTRRSRWRCMFGGEGFSNPGRHTTPEVQAAIDATQVVQSPEERTAALQGRVRRHHRGRPRRAAVLPDHAERLQRPGDRRARPGSPASRSSGTSG